MTRLALLLAVAAAACGDRESGIDPLCTTWQALPQTFDRSTLSVWGTADDDVFIVGGSMGSPGGALALHWNGKTFDEIPTGSNETLWWVWGAGPTDVWMVGENGTILRWDGHTVTDVPSGTTAHLYGVWGSSSSDVWIVGGRPGPEDGPDDVILHFDGEKLTAEDMPARDAAMFKVWGTGDEVFVTGEQGTIWHRLDGRWRNESAQVNTQETLATVHGCARDEVYAVGGSNIYRYDGAIWSPVGGTQLLATATGVSCGPSGVLVVGSGGLKLVYDRASGAWRDDTLEAPYDTDFHGAWVSPGGDLWATGGNYIAPASAVDHRFAVLAIRQSCSSSQP